MTREMNRYNRMIEKLFFNNYREGADTVEFTRDEMAAIAKGLKIALPKNLGDIIYSFRYRTSLPESIRQTAPAGAQWAIRSTGKSRYKFFLTRLVHITPNELISETKIPDATPAIITKYALNDEQSLLARLRYNRLVDIFTGVTCYSLQSHLRTSVPAIGQVETDELYVGLDKQGVHYIIPVQAKGGSDRIGVVQIEQDFAMCQRKFPSLVCRPVAAQFMTNNVIALFGFELTDRGITICAEKHYRLVEQEELSEEDLRAYRERLTA